MKYALLLAALSCACAIAGEPPLHEIPLPEAKAMIQIPDGWSTSAENEDGVFVYKFAQPGNAGAKEPASITLSVTTKVRERTEQSPSEYAAALVDVPQDDGTSAPVQKSNLCGLPLLRSEYTIEGETGNVRAVSIAVPNDQSGTLYFFAWHIPPGDAPEMETLREKIVNSAKFDPAF